MAEVTQRPPVEPHLSPHSARAVGCAEASLARQVSDGKGTLVRGFSTHRDTLSDEAQRDAALSHLCVGALDGWAGVDPQQVTVKDYSGGGGSQTYRVTAPAGVQPTSVAVHSRSEKVTSDALSEPMTEAAAAILGKAGLAPRRLAYGKNWFVEAWEGIGSPDHDGDDLPKEMGQMIAALHSIDTKWFDSWRQKLREHLPTLAGVHPGSHVWWFARRADEWLGPKSSDWLEAYGAASYQPLSSAGQVVVTTHGDCHRANIVRTEGGLKFIDLEFSGVQSAVHDLSYAITCCGWPESHALWANENRKHRAFLRSYLETMGRPSAEADVEILLLDCLVYKEFLHCGTMSPWRVESVSKIELWQTTLAQALDSQESRSCIISAQHVWGAEPFKEMKLELERLRWKEVAVAVKSSKWYAMQQEALQSASSPPAVRFSVPVSIDGKEVITIRVGSDKTLSLQQLLGTDRLVLSESIEGDANQQWIKLGGGLLQHRATGLFLDAEVKFAHIERLGQPWETCGSALFLKPRCEASVGGRSQRQCWRVEENGMIRHVFDGRVLDVNCGQLQSGTGVNVNVPHTMERANGFCWEVSSVHASADASLGQEMPATLVANTDATSESLCCNPCGVELSEVVTPIIPEFAHEESFVITCAAAPSYCISCKPRLKCAREGCNNLQHTIQGHGYCCHACKAGGGHGGACEHERHLPGEHPALIRCGKVTGDATQQWRLVNGDRLQNVASRLFLTTETKYMFVRNVHAPWEGNGTALKTAARDDANSDRQRWLLTTQEFKKAGWTGASSAAVLRHYKDGRAVDVHGWRFSDGGNMGVEGSAHSDCRGVAYRFLAPEAAVEAAAKAPQQQLPV